MENEATAPSRLGASPLQLWAWHTVGAQQATSECVKGEAAKTPAPTGSSEGFVGGDEATPGPEPAAPGS